MTDKQDFNRSIFYFGAGLRRPASISVLIRETLIDGTSKKVERHLLGKKKKFSQNAIFKKKYGGVLFLARRYNTKFDKMIATMQVERGRVCVR